VKTEGPPGPIPGADSSPTPPRPVGTLADGAAPLAAPEGLNSPARGAMTPRAALAADLAAHMARLLAAGDVEGARIAGDAMMKLLGAAHPGEGAAVLALGAERRRRER